MKNNLFTVSFLLTSSLVLLAGCSNEDLPGKTANPDSGIARQVTATAGIGSPHARIAFEEDAAGALKTTWKKDDTFTITTSQGDKSATFTLSGEGGSANGTFTGTLTDDYTGPVIGIYPAVGQDKLTDGKVILDLGQQSGKLDESLLAYMKATATYTVGESLAFDPFTTLTAIVKLTLNNIPDGVTLSEVVLNGKGLRNKKEMSLSDGSFDTFNSSEVYKISATGTFTKDQNVVYFSVFDCSPTEIKVTATTSDNKKYEASLVDATLQNGYFYSVTADLAEFQDPAYQWYKQGQASGTFELSSFDALEAFAGLVNGNQTALNAVGASGALDFAGKTVKLAADIDMGTTNWTPIGRGGMNSYYFKGTFDGNGKTLSGNITFVNADDLPFGFFGYVKDGAVIKNVNVEYTMTVNPYEGSMVGCLVGDVDNATIEYCMNGSSIEIPVDNPSKYLGGIVGKLSGDNAKVIACHNTGNISGAGGSVGGIVGYCLSGEIVGCINTGLKVITKETSENKNPSVGGICGTGNKIIACWSNVVEIKVGDATNHPLSGILSGVLSQEIKQCYGMAIGSLPTVGQKMGSTEENCETFSERVPSPTVEQMNAMNTAWGIHDSGRQYKYEGSGLAPI